MTTVTVITPFHNGHELLDDYAAALQWSSADKVIVIDNGSDPRIPWRDPWWQLVRNEENRGFTRACNHGLAAATTDAVLFLNNDVRATGPGDWLEPIRQMLRPGLLVGAQLRRDEHGDIDGRPHAYLDGWCLAGLTADLRKLGGFDETYLEPAYYCENDLCLRAKRAGMRLAQVPVALEHLTNRTARSTYTQEQIATVTRANREKFAALERRAA